MRRKYKSRFWQRAFSKSVVCFSAIVFLTTVNSCRTAKVDLRRLAPADAIVYLETNDLGKILASLAENQAFREVSNAAPDFSALANVQLAIAVTDFETSENQVTNENSILNFTARFVAVAETHAWQWQTVSLVKNQLNNFVLKNYGAETALEKSDRWDGKFFAWSAKDGRKVFAFVKNSRICFGNDAAAIEQCSAENGKSQDSANRKISERAAFADAENNLAFGYVSSEGIKRIADLTGVAVAVETSEEAEAKSFIARILPQILQKTTEEIVWTAVKTERGIEDNFKVSLNQKVAAVTNETLKPTGALTGAADLLPAEFFSATRYDLKNPLLAWRSLLLLTTQNADALSGNLLLRFSGALLEPYGVADAEKFLSAIDSEIITMQFDESGEKSAGDSDGHGF